MKKERRGRERKDERNLKFLQVLFSKLYFTNRKQIGDLLSLTLSLLLSLFSLFHSFSSKEREREKQKKEILPTKKMDQ